MRPFLLVVGCLAKRVDFDVEFYGLDSGSFCRRPARCPCRSTLQEVKFKSYYHDLHWALTEYDRVVTEVRVYTPHGRGRPCLC